ncbi:gas vesicle structural protein GvpA [Salipaludibacillus sp. CUR1]|jgi:gas vesicle structural protein|uniref:Gas vesicle protein A n=1 Tax=Salipaludibacillus aurantiacus TaxID=1601833 RepID=A0A1H9NXC4_9BACI|nr:MULTISPECIES: gas vesicle structural protein GvpA [Salipaludibacillus]MCE7793262.1 gas vesicle structural protein GvpA [Salipaludibacillus sp. CUR1]SER40590.1 Gas vesicle protein [Salipaludibacillus aurantiacus]
MAIQKSTDSSSLAEVIDRILDKGIVIDLYARISLVGIELITIEARVVIASVDTWLRYAEAVGLLRDEVQGEIDLETSEEGRGQEQLNFA